MLPKFANPHSLLQDVEITTRSEIAGRAGFTSIVDDENSHSLKRDLDILLRDTWADALAEAPSRSRAQKYQKTAESHKDEDGQLGFRLVSGMDVPRYLTLSQDDSNVRYHTRSSAPSCEDDETRAEVRRRRALSVAIDSDTLGVATVSTRQLDCKFVTVESKAPLAETPLARPLPPLLVTEEDRGKTTVWRVQTCNSRASDCPAASPHEPRLSCVVLPVISARNYSEMPGKRRRKHVKERPPPAYWRPSPDMRGKCMGYALGYPSSWAPDRLYVRDAMKKGVYAVHDMSKSK